MDAKALKEITSELNLLYVEDDVNLREETAKLFSHLFASIDTAENGQVAFDKFQNSHYDLIVTDINMPIMDGVSLCKKIREVKAEQAIIITSAHDDSSYLLELIDIGIDKFVLKPFDMQQFLTSLNYVCSNIFNKKLITQYKEELESSNQKLSKSNLELESMIKILDNKIIQMNQQNRIIQKVPQQSLKDAINTISSNPPNAKKSLVKESKDLFVYNEYMIHNDLERLAKLELEMDSIISLFKHQKEVEVSAITQLAQSLQKYAIILDTYALFKSLSKEISLLSQALLQQPPSHLNGSEDICMLLESFIYVLKKWHASLFDTGVKDPNIYDQSMISDIENILELLQPSTQVDNIEHL